VKPLPYVDRRAELRALRDQQRDMGNHEAAAVTERELLAAEALAATRPEAAVHTPWGNAARPLPAA
jgi:hypothetical protein